MAPSDIDLTSLEPSLRFTRLTSVTTISQSSLANAFSRIMPGEKGRDLILRDTCIRPTPQYKTNYNPYAIPREDLLTGYSPYVFKEPLYNDLPKNCIVTPLAKRTRLTLPEYNAKVPLQPLIPIPIRPSNDHHITSFGFQVQIRKWTLYFSLKPLSIWQTYLTSRARDKEQRNVQKLSLIQKSTCEIEG
ncbi:hypothetical protein NA56DRAFT_660012 [Hyaloscypha hepaticicola]|uniref:Uncharacterized protein n=1 Tax=Hyaloscypha hepaticicola TaxID=2082293 RepID=A0A2J6Q1G0_9HELO|nr:hypothetical protein NA56DRAFT_660012 [Hyaloscypha hepaticicola]